MNQLPTSDPLPSNLPPPGADATAHSEALRGHIRHVIEAAGGSISFARFMSLALYAPGLGYYVAGSRKFGAEGDFVTAPELSPLFSRCLARQIEQVLADLGGGDVLEAGGGSGAMARDILLALEAQDSLPGSYFILELSPELRQRQRETIEQGAPHLLPRVVWLDSLPRHGFRGVLVGNEVLDAMPVNIVQMSEQGWRERYVGWDDASGFVWQEGELSSPELGQHLKRLEQELGSEPFIPGYITEVNLAGDAWVRSVAEFMAAGVVLLVDYGFPQHEFYHPERASGTLMCHYRHRAHADPLILVGLQDITAHVDFTAIAHAAVGAGLDVAGYTAQAHFLLGCGLAELAELEPEGEVRRHLDTTQQIKKLTQPNEMGELFKVIALSKQYDGLLQGFMLQDRRGRL